MKVSFDWLKELTGIKWTVEKTAEELARLGFPVESITATGVKVQNVVSVKILSVSKHPNADRLQIAQVTDGKSERTIVCGAPNIAAGQVVPCALPGAHLPGDINIVVSKIRGVESHGMLCSARELQLSEDHDGIYQLPASTPLGKELSDVLGGDTVLDIEVTPNRPDLLSHVGVARELAALSGAKLNLPKASFKTAASGPACEIRIDEPKLCSRYTGKLLHGVKVGPSPDWMVRRLKACGIRSINNIVDITNYVLLEYGHPLHAFDLAKLAGPEIIVRKAKAGEKLLALDEKEYKLDASDLVIADAQEPVAIAGIMGGQPTGVTDSTTDILLESAVFDRVTVRQTSRRLVLRSESSIRFEKGTDADTALQASVRAAQLIRELAGGKEGKATDKYPVKEKAHTVPLREKRLTQVLGAVIPKAKIASMLKNLNLKPVASGGGWKCSIPSYRQDLLEEVDLIEEVVRLTGYDDIPSIQAPFQAGHMGGEYKKWDDTALIATLQGLGISETMTSSFCSIEAAGQVGVAKENLVSLANPLSQEETVMRPLLLPNLLKAALRNFNHQRNAAALFEIGSVAVRAGEKRSLGIILAGQTVSQTWQSPAKSVDIYYLKGVIQTLSDSLGISLTLSPEAAQSFLHPHQSFKILFQGKPAGWAGMIHPSLAAELDLTAPFAAAEIDYTVFCKEPALKAEALPKYPFVERDIAVIVDKRVQWADIQKAVRQAGGSLLVAAWPFDVFSGGSLQQTQKSLAFRLRLQHSDHTLSESEITSTVDAIKASLQKNCGAQLR